MFSITEAPWYFGKRTETSYGDFCAEIFNDASIVFSYFYTF